MVDAINSRVDHIEQRIRKLHEAGRLRTSEMAQWVRMLATKSEDLTSNPRTKMEE